MAHYAIASLLAVFPRADPLERSRRFELVHIRLVVAETFPRPDIVAWLGREPLRHAVIILDDLGLLLHIEIAERTRGIEVVIIGAVIVPGDMIVPDPEIEASQEIVAAVARLLDMHHFMDEHSGDGIVVDETVVPAP